MVFGVQVLRKINDSSLGAFECRRAWIRLAARSGVRGMKDLVVQETSLGDWEVREADGSLVSEHATQQQAIESAKVKAALFRGAVIWRGSDGTVAGRITYRSTPARSSVRSRIPR
jgi:hypothetical protein